MLALILSLTFVAGLISDMESQLSEGGAGAAELAKAKKRLEQELEEVRTSMEVCEMITNVLI